MFCIMSSNSRWFLDTQHSFSFKAEHEIRVVHPNSNLRTALPFPKLLLTYYTYTVFYFNVYIRVSNTCLGAKVVCSTNPYSCAK